MKVFEYGDPTALRPRAHPWSHTDADPAHRYVDFRTHPELIRSSVEDLRGGADHPATETFYRLLEWLNGPESVFESNDCAFNGVAANESPTFQAPFECSGRVMILLRDLIANTSPGHVARVGQVIAMRMSDVDPGFEWGAVASTAVSVRFTTLAAPPERQWGHQLMLSFWSWGQDPIDTLDNLDRTLGSLSAALRQLSDELR